MTSERKYNCERFDNFNYEDRRRAVLNWLQEQDPNNFFIISINEISPNGADPYTVVWYYTNDFQN